MILRYLMLWTFHLTFHTATQAEVLGTCWRVSNQNEPCKGKLLSRETTEKECCSGGNKFSWSRNRESSLNEFIKTEKIQQCRPCISALCKNVSCGEDRRCVLRGGVPTCTCSPHCKLRRKSLVCGTDGRTYASECHLLKRACRKRKRLMVAHYGHCQTCNGVRCGKKKRCVLDDRLQPQCIRCPVTCDGRKRKCSFCGSDGVTYSSFCHMKKGSCASGKTISIAYRGPCRENATCSSVRCRKDDICLTREDGPPMCTSCSTLQSCMPDLQTVCGSDGRMYPSWCALLHESCQSGFALSAIESRLCKAGQIWTMSSSVSFQNGSLDHNEILQKISELRQAIATSSTTTESLSESERRKTSKKKRRKKKKKRHKKGVFSNLALTSTMNYSKK